MSHDCGLFMYCKGVSFAMGGSSHSKYIAESNQPLTVGSKFLRFFGQQTSVAGNRFPEAGAGGDVVCGWWLTITLNFSVLKDAGSSFNTCQYVVLLGFADDLKSIVFVVFSDDHVSLIQASK